MEKNNLVALRDGDPADRAFVLSTILRGLYYGNTMFGLIPKDIFMENYHTIAEKLLDSPTTILRVACLKDDPEVILGYSMLNSTQTILHWVFTKSAWRGIGIAKSLVPPTVKFTTHLTTVGTALLKSRPTIKYNPFNFN